MYFHVTVSVQQFLVHAGLIGKPLFRLHFWAFLSNMDLFRCIIFYRSILFMLFCYVCNVCLLCFLYFFFFFFFWGIKNVRYVKSKNFLGLYIFYAAM